MLAASAPLARVSQSSLILRESFFFRCCLLPGLCAFKQIKHLIFAECFFTDFTSQFIKQLVGRQLFLLLSVALLQQKAFSRTPW